MYYIINLFGAAASPRGLFNLKDILDVFSVQALGFLKGILIAVIIILIGRKLIKAILHIVNRYFEHTKMEVSAAGFLIAFLRTVLFVILILIAVSFIGIESSSIVALVGSAGLTLGLALQGSLSNFAGGVLILILKPFRVGDYIISGNYEGTVTSIDLFYTRLLTFDNKLLVMPNGALSNGNIINVSYEENRRLDITIPIDYSENVQKVKDIINEIILNHEMVLKDKDIKIYVGSMDQGTVSIGIRVWVANENYWTLKWELLEQMKEKFDSNHISIPFHQFRVEPKQ